MKFLYNPPGIIKKLFNRFNWESNSDNILFTFDDGPNPLTTDNILRKLEERKIKGIFFCVGENLEKYTSIASEIIAEGHELGNHTYSHQKITNQSYLLADESIKKVQIIAEEKLNYSIKFFRPPHGRFNLRTKRLLANNNLTNVMWSLLTYDYKNDLNIVKFAIENYLMKNSIIVLHDSLKSKNIITESIEYILKIAEKKNYSIGKPSECLKSYF